MAEYTYKDVIIDPEDPRVEIGKEYFYGDVPVRVLRWANADDSRNHMVLDAVNLDCENPFAVRGMAWNVLIRKKEPEKKYVPFDLSKEEDRDALRGKWIRDARWGNEWMIVGFFFDRTGGGCWRVKLSRREAGFSGSELLERFTFLDGSLCGRPANGQQME